MVSMKASAKRPPHELGLVIDFANTLDREAGTDSIATPDQLAAWLQQDGLLDRGAPPLTAANHDEAIDLRESLRALMLANNGAPARERAARKLAHVARRGELGVQFASDASVSLRASVAGFHGALAQLLVPVAHASLDGSWRRVKACRAPECLEAFYDHSPNRAGVWCDMALCGNRSKVRAYRGRNPGQERTTTNSRS